MIKITLKIWSNERGLLALYSLLLYIVSEN